MLYFGVHDLVIHILLDIICAYELYYELVMFYRHINYNTSLIDVCVNWW